MYRQRTWAIGLAAVLFFAVLFSFPAVRAAASDFLGLFRVQKFAPISISPEQMAMLEQLAEGGRMVLPVGGSGHQVLRLVTVSPQTTFADLQETVAACRF